jgi:hypothetical protein
MTPGCSQYLVTLLAVYRSTSVDRALFKMEREEADSTSTFKQVRKRRDNIEVSEVEACCSLQKGVSANFVRSDVCAAGHHQSYRRTREVSEISVWRLGGFKMLLLP